MKQKRLLPRFMALALCAVMVLAMAACSGSETPAADGEGGGDSAAKDTLVVVASGDPANMDPNDSDSQTHYQFTRQIYETLFVYDENYEIQPWLCESYEYEDDETIILHIRQGVKFHNGDELKASDVLFTFRRIIENNLVAFHEVSALNLDACEVVDEYTLKLVTNGPAATQIALLENPAASILSERAYTEANGDFTNGAAVGTGPYKFVSYAPGDRVEMVAFEDYWVEGEPHIPNLTIRIISDNSSRSIEAETLGSDIVYDINAKDLEAVDAAEGVSIISELGTNTTHLLLNTKIAPLDDPLVREAVFLAADPQAMVQLAYGDYGSFAQGWVCPGILGFDATIMDTLYPKRDVERAKELLAEAGYADGLELEIAVANNNQERCDMAEALQAQLVEAGINLKVNIMESSTWNSYIMTGDQQMTLYGFSCTDFEADRALIQFMPSNVNYNICQYDDPDFQALVNEAAVTLDTAAREDLYKQAINMLMEDYVTLPLWHKALNAAVSDELGGFEITRSYEQHYLQKVYYK